MKKLDLDKIARIMGGSRAEIEARGGYFGALQLAEDVRALRTPAGGGRPTDPAWEKKLIGVASRTEKALDEIARQMSVESGKPIGPMQVAALLLDRAVRQYQANHQLDLAVSAPAASGTASPETPVADAVGFPQRGAPMLPRKKRAAGGSR